MAFKQTYSGSFSLTAQGTHVNQEIISNQSSAEPWDDHDLTIVDGQLTVIGDTDDLVGIRFILAHEDVVDGDLDDTDPSAEDPQVWYSFWSARGPLVFRLISKKTIHPEQKMWIQVWKGQGSTATITSWGLNLMIQGSAFS